ncbi:MAG: PorT family protein [Dysgonamonadaceae bacterium]|jgi:hypothetical protein|nr:PorT family protein [Dysgonamonadaceae bacterium]
MKRVIGITVFIFAIGIVQSQTLDFRSEWAFGVNAGVTLSRMGFLPRVPQTLLVQETGGFTARYISEKNCGVLVELNYSLRGWKEEADTVSHFNTYSRSLAYIEIPVLTHFYIDLGKRARMALNLGPQIGCNIGEKMLEKKIVIPPNGEESTVPRYYDDDYTVQRKFDYGIAGGLGLEVRTGIGSFILEGRYYYGLSDVFNNSRGDIFQSSHNQVIGLKLAYLVKW